MGGQRHDVAGDGLLVLAAQRTIAIGRAGLIQNLAGQPFRNSEDLLGILDASPAASRGTDGTRITNKEVEALKLIANRRAL